MKSRITHMAGSLASGLLSSLSLEHIGSLFEPERSVSLTRTIKVDPLKPALSNGTHTRQRMRQIERLTVKRDRAAHLAVHATDKNMRRAHNEYHKLLQRRIEAV